MISKLNVVLRTCDRVSLQPDRLVDKAECIRRCLRSLVASLEACGHPYHLHIIDDASSDETRRGIDLLAPMATKDWLEPRDQTGLNAKQKSRHSVRIAYEHIDTLSADELVYIVEDDHLHWEGSVYKMLEAWRYFQNPLVPVDIGIWPQDFRQIHYHPLNPSNDTYVTNCMVYPGPDRYYRTVWYTHESFLVPVRTIHRYREHFAELLRIGDEPHLWEGNTINKVWQKPDVRMLMPLGTLILHLGCADDISFYTDWLPLWEHWA